MKPYLFAILLSVAFLGAGSPVRAQESDYNFTRDNIDPSFIGGDTAWNHFLGQNLHYPDDAVSNEIQGTVMLKFKVELDGTISNIEVVSGPKKGGLREEAIRVIKLSNGKWNPGIYDGKYYPLFAKKPI